MIVLEGIMFVRWSIVPARCWCVCRKLSCRPFLLGIFLCFLVLVFTTLYTCRLRTLVVVFWLPGMMAPFTWISGEFTNTQSLSSFMKMINRVGGSPVSMVLIRTLISLLSLMSYVRFARFVMVRGWLRETLT